MRATGQPTSGTIHAAMLSGDGEPMFNLTSRPGKEAHVALSGADGTPLGIARCDDLSLDLLALSPETQSGRSPGRAARRMRCPSRTRAARDRSALKGAAPGQRAEHAEHLQHGLPPAGRRQPDRVPGDDASRVRREYHVAIGSHPASAALRALAVLAAYVC